MLIHRISAEWRNQTRDALELRDGLNLIEERGENVKTDWPAVICAALFGPDAYDAELTRVEAECQASGRHIIVSRAADADAPEFQATDENGDAVEDVTAESVGEALTGVSRDIYAQIACVSVDAPSDGDGETLRELQTRIDRAQARITELEQQEMTLNQELRDVDSGQAAENLPELSVLTAAYAAMREKLEADNVPELDSIARLRGAIINIMTAGKQLDKAEAEQEAAERVLADAKADVDAMPFAGMTPEEAEQSALKLPFKPVIPKWLAIAFGIAVVIGAAFLFRNPAVWYPFAWTAFVALGIFAGWGVRKLGERWEVMAAQRREQWEADLIRYAEVYRVMEEAQAAADIKIAAADTLRESLSTNERGILREIHRFAPEVSSMPEADAQLRLCARRRKELAIAETVVRKAEALEAKRAALMAIPALSAIELSDRRQAASDGVPEVADGDAQTATASPERGKLIRTLNAVREEREALRLEIRRDREELSERNQAAARRFARVPMSIWDRALLSLGTLKEAENLPDDAFPKELAPRTVEIFHALTDNQHAERKIFTPGRISSLFSGAEGSSLRKFLEARDSLDVFCLSVCLTVFERTFSGAEYPPLILRDVLRGFDERCRAASIRFLETMAQNGQILFFTSDERETYTPGDSADV